MPKKENPSNGNVKGCDEPVSHSIPIRYVEERYQLINSPDPHSIDHAHSYQVKSMDYGSFQRMRRGLSSSSQHASEILRARLRKTPSISLINAMRDSAGRVSRTEMDEEQDYMPARSMSSLAIESEMEGDHELSGEQQKTSVWMAGYNVTNLIQGIGIMGIPYACATVGWASVFVIIVVALLSGFTALLIGECLYKSVPRNTNMDNYDDNKKTDLVKARTTYSCIAADVWPNHGRRIITVLVLTELFGAVVLYLILLGDSTAPLVNYLAGTQYSIGFYTAAFGYCVFPCLLIGRMRFIAWFSMLAVAGLLVAIATVLIYCFTHITLDKLSFEHFPTPILSKVPVSLGVMIFSYCAHPVLPGIEVSMSNPSQYPCMIRTTFALAAITKAIFGIGPVLLFGSGVAQVVVDSITDTPNIVSITRFAIGVNAFASVPLLVYIIGEQLDAVMQRSVGSRVFQPEEGGVWYSVWLSINRFVLLSFALVIAIYVPHFVLIMALIGAVTGSCLTFILPAVFHIKLFRFRLSMAQLFIRKMVIVFGTFTLIFGFIFSCKDLYDEMSK